MAILASRELPDVAATTAVLVVPDVLKALGRLARYWRVRTGALVVALSGSAGKTTVKDFLAAIMSRLVPVVKTPGNYNNQLGLPLTILAASENERIWVLEAGVSKPGDMDELGDICQPDLAMVHNVGPAHLEGLGSVTGVAKAKARLFAHVRRSGWGVANMDYPELWDAACEVFPDVRGMSTKVRVVPYFGSYTGPDAQGGECFNLILEGDVFRRAPALSCSAHAGKRAGGCGCGPDTRGLQPRHRGRSGADRVAQAALLRVSSGRLDRHRRHLQRQPPVDVEGH